MVNLQDPKTKMIKEGSLYYMKTLFVNMYCKCTFIHLLKCNLLKLNEYCNNIVNCNVIIIARKVQWERIYLKH